MGTDGDQAGLDVDVVVVGAGMAGLYLLHEFRSIGVTAVALDAASDVGGTWYWNRYPGARCDIQSLDYQYTFDPELQRDWKWSEKYATQPEILRYLEHVADRYDLRRDIRFDTARMRAAVDDPRGYLLATEAADWLVRRGVPFREAHEAVGKLVSAAEGRGVALEALPLAVFTAAHAAFDESVFEALSPEAAVAARGATGGTAPDNVARQLAAWRQRLAGSD